MASSRSSLCVLLALLALVSCVAAVPIGKLASRRAAEPTEPMDMDVDMDADLMEVEATQSSSAGYSFTSQPIDPKRVVAMAVPIGQTGTYNLVIVEQQKDTKKCFALSGSQPTRVDPLLLKFNFAGICGRATDANGYSIRMGGKDVGMQMQLKVIKQGNDLLLVGSGRGPQVTIGRAGGIPSGGGFAQLRLNSGWRFSKRVWSGKVLGHIYVEKA